MKKEFESYKRCKHSIVPYTYANNLLNKSVQQINISLFKTRLMKPLKTNRTPQPILGFILIHKSFHAVRAGASEFRKGIKISINMTTSLSCQILLAVTRLLAVGKEIKINGYLAGRSSW